MNTEIIKGGKYGIPHCDDNPFKSGDYRVVVRVKDVRQGWVLFGYMVKNKEPRIFDESTKADRFLDIFELIAE